MTIPRVSPRRRAKRLSLSAKKKLHPERYCANLRCYTAPSHIGRCTKHAKEHLDRLVRSLVVRPDSECQAAEWHRHLFPCGGRIEVNHLIEREYLLVRWDLRNVIAGCKSLNVWAYRRKREWARMCRDWLGVVYDELERRALSKDVPDYAAALAALANAEGG